MAGGAGDGGHGGNRRSGSHPNPLLILHLDGRRRDEGSGEGMEDLRLSTGGEVRLFMAKLHVVSASREIGTTRLPAKIAPDCGLGGRWWRL